LALKKTQSPFKQMTFWKAFAVLFIHLVLFVTFLWIVREQNSNRNNRSATDGMIRNRVQQITKMIEDRLVTRYVDQLLELVEPLESNVSDLNRLLVEWLSERETVISVSLWLKNQESPSRTIQTDFLSALQVRRMTNEDRRILLSYIYSKKIAIRETGKPFVIGEIISDNFMGYPILSIGIPLGDASRIEALEIKIGLKSIDDTLKEIVQEGEALDILNSSGNLLFSTERGKPMPLRVPDSEEIIWEEDQILTCVPLPNIPWNVLFTKQAAQISQKPANPFDYLIVILIIGCIVITLSAVILSRWIDHPQKKLITAATEMARGNFNLRLPVQKNKTMNRLVKLFNYMAEEMDRLQKMDVSEIINEKNKTETILQHIADGVVVTDPQDRILVINSVAEKWFGLNEKNVTRKPIRQCIKNQPLISLLQEVKDGRPHSSAELSIDLISTKEKKIFQAHAARVHNPEDKLIGVVTVIRDVTKEKEADRIKTELVSMVAHELKSPLTSIYGFSELLLDSELNDPQAKEYAQVILTESTRLTDLINKFLDLSRLEAGRTEIHMIPFDLRQVVDKIAAVYKGQAEVKEIKVITEMPRRLPLAFGDPDMIEQVLLNLFSNAVKYSPNHSKVGIEAKVNEKEIVISVIDNGYGIPSEAIGRIFDKFYRVAASEGTEEVEGSGLGLTLAKEIVEKHGGTITVNSRLGIGSIFSFSIPRTEK